MSQCIKTGCHVYLTEYNEWAYGDAYEQDDLLICQIVERGFKPIEQRKHFSIHRLAHIFGPCQPSESVMSILIAGKGDWVNHGYDGTDVQATRISGENL